MVVRKVLFFYLLLHFYSDSGSEAMHIPRSQRSGHPTLAKSLPVTVPAFHSFGQRLIQEEDDEQVRFYNMSKI